MNVLSDPGRFRELHAALLLAFDETDLPMLVRFTYPPAFGKTIDWQKPLEAVITQLLEEVEQRDDPEPLIRGALQARPNKEEIVRFCRVHLPQAFEPAAQADLVLRVTGGLEALIDALRDPKIRLSLGRFQADIDTVRDRIRTLEAYKILHDGLHNLEQLLRSIADAASKFQLDPTPSSLQLNRAAGNLRREARRSDKAAKGLPTEVLELSWIEELRQAVTAMEEAVKGGDLNSLGGAVESLKGLVSQATRINGILCTLAADMRLGALIDALATIAKRIPDQGEAGGPAARLRSGQSALKGLRAEFARRVAEHQEWQWLDRKLSTIDTSRENEPTKKVVHWSEVRKRLDRLCNLFPEEEWYVELRSQRENWETASASANWKQSAAAADTFRSLASNRFFDVDGELNSLCGKLIEVAIPLDTIVEVLSDDHQP